MLDDSIKAQLAAYFERITQPITLIASLDDSEGAQQIRELVTEVAAVAPAKISARFDGSFEPLRVRGKFPLHIERIR